MIDATPKRPPTFALGAALLSGLLLTPHTALALQPLSAFVTAAKQHNFDQREADATVEQSEAKAESGRRKLLPTLSARGVYAHNQYQTRIVVPGSAAAITITPYNQLDAFFNADVPLINFASWSRIGSNNTALEAAKYRAQAQTLDVEQSVTQNYYQLIAATEVVASAQHALETTGANLEHLEKRRAAGLAIELDYQRAVAERERSKQVVANAEYLSGQASRALALLTGLAPEATNANDLALLHDDLHDEPPLAHFLRGETEETAAMAASRLEAKSAKESADATWHQLLPVLSAGAQEHLTNATGFSGKSAAYQLSATLSWSLDASVASDAKAQTATQKLAEIRSERAARTQRDAVENAYAVVTSQLIATRAARAEAEASRLAEKIALERYQAGTILQMDALDASREAFQSEAARLQAEADLASARATLRIVSNRATSGQGKP